MKHSILSFLLILSFTFSQAQQYPPIVDGSNSIELEAAEIANQYDKELAMTAKQKALFKLKVEDYLILRQRIESEYEGKKELDALVELQVHETLDMNDILTRVQMQVYKKVKPSIQPLKMVDSK